MSSRKIEDLHPDLQEKCKQFLKIAEKNNIDVIITCTYRSNEEQDKLYAIGRNSKGAVVTRAKGGQSAHNYILNGKPAAKAFDVVPIVNGKCAWNITAPEWQILGEIGKSLGLKWYGEINSKFREFPHFELQENK